MITLEQAQRLKAAGFPQDYSPYEHGYICGTTVAFGNPRLAAPNSDELIAAIQERWECYISVAGQLLEWRAGYAKQVTPKPHPPDVIYVEAKSPFSALIDLYCKLAGSEVA